MSWQKSLIASLFVVPIALGAGCRATPQEQRDDHLKRGDAFIAHNQLPEAIVEYRSATQADMLSGVAHQKLAEAYVTDNDLPKAFIEFIRAADLLPDDIALQIRAGQMLLIAERYEDAKGRAEKVLAKNPKNVEAQIIKGNALAGLKDLTGALAQMDEAVRSDPSKSMAYANLGLIQYAKGDIARSEAAFKTAIASDPNSILARLALVNLYWATRRPAEAEKALHEALAIDPNDLLANRSLAMFYLSSGRPADAETPLKVVADKSPNGNGRLGLADYYLTVRRVPEAKALLDKLATEPDKELSATAKLRLAAIKLSTGDRAGTYGLIDEVLKGSPKNTEALIAKAHLQLEDDKRPEALVTIRAAVESDKNSASAQYVLGLVLAAGNQNDEAIAAYQAALQVNPRFAPAALEIARLSLRAGKYAEAAQFAKVALQIVPGYSEAHLLLARAEIASGHPALAEDSMRMLSKNFPNDPIVAAEAGRYLLARGDLPGAQAAFQRSLAGDPTQLTAIQGLCDIDIRQKNGPAARARIEKAVAANPRSAPLQLFAARIYLSLDDSAAAEKVLKQVLAADSTNLEAYDLLAGLYFQQKRLPEATAEFERLAQADPKSITNQTSLALLLQIQGKTDEAKARYEKILGLDPHAAVAANNLAQLYADHDGNLDVALTLAQTAKAGMPQSHEVDDTMGWIYYKKKLASLAIESFKRSVSAAPDNPVYLYHLGLAYAQNNDKAMARQSLEQALKKSANFDGADDARKVLQTLKG
jgi:tetratricopeptide (TPR) repeat protein